MFRHRVEMSIANQLGDGMIQQDGMMEQSGHGIGGAQSGGQQLVVQSEESQSIEGGEFCGVGAEGGVLG